MATITRQSKKERSKPAKRRIHRTRRGSSVNFLDESPTALARSASLDTIAARVPTRIRLVPNSGARPQARINIELPEGTVVRLLALNELSEVVDTLIEGWLPAGTHELRNLCLPNGAYKLRLETPSTWYIAGIMIG